MAIPTKEKYNQFYQAVRRLRSEEGWHAYVDYFQSFGVLMLLEQEKGDNGLPENCQTLAKMFMSVPEWKRIIGLALAYDLGSIPATIIEVSNGRTLKDIMGDREFECLVHIDTKGNISEATKEEILDETESILREEFN